MDKALFVLFSCQMSNHIFCSILVRLQSGGGQMGNFVESRSFDHRSEKSGPGISALDSNLMIG